MSSAIAFAQACRLGAGARAREWRSAALMTLLFTSLAVSGGNGFAQTATPYTLAAGSKLYIRLELIISTRTSHLNEPVKTRVVRDITNGDWVLVPIGSEVTGKIVKIIPPMDTSDHARLLIKFTELAIQHRSPMPIKAHVTEVENAREKVLPDGTIQGILEKDVAAGRVDDIFGKLGAAGDQMTKVSGKTLGKVDTAIEYPAGTDITLTLDEPLTVQSASPPTVPSEISPTLASSLQNMLSGAPQRVQSKSKKPGDPLNLIIVGSQEQILAAFKQAGWSEAGKLGTKSAVGTVRAMASDNGLENAPVSQLYLFGRVEDLAFEKTLNTFLKRHHLRLWRTLVTTPDGRAIWVGASTHDIGLDVHFRVVSHEIDPDLDAERNKVGADLMASGLVVSERLVARPNPLTEGRTATGGTWKTDGQLLVIVLKSSRAI